MMNVGGRKDVFFVGVYPRDKLPAVDFPRPLVARIINFDMHVKPKQHWLGVKPMVE